MAPPTDDGAPPAKRIKTEDMPETSNTNMTQEADPFDEMATKISISILTAEFRGIASNISLTIPMPEANLRKHVDSMLLVHGIDTNDKIKSGIETLKDVKEIICEVAKKREEQIKDYLRLCSKDLVDHKATPDTSTTMTQEKKCSLGRKYVKYVEPYLIACDQLKTDLRVIGFLECMIAKKTNTWYR